MRTNLLALLATIAFAIALHAADIAEPAPKPQDPMLWSPPAKMPKIVARVTLDRATKDNALKKVKAIIEKRKNYPETGLIVDYIVPGSRAESMELVKGDILLKIDDTPLTKNSDLTDRGNTIRELVFVSPGKPEKSATLFPGRIGVYTSAFDRDNPLHFDGNLRDPRWADELQIVNFLCDTQPLLAEAALAKAVDAGLEQDANVNGIAARLARRSYHYDEAMNLAWYALKEHANDEDAYLLNMCACCNYKLEVILDYMKAHPNETNPNRESYEQMIAAHKALPNAERITLPPSLAAKKLFKDDMLLRAKEIPMMLDGNPSVPERFLDGLLYWRHAVFTQEHSKYGWVGFKPAVKNIYMRCVFTMHQTEKVTSQFSSQDYFRIAVDTYKTDQEDALVTQSSQTTGLGAAIAPGQYPTYIQNHFQKGLGWVFADEFPQLMAAAANPAAEQELTLIVLNGRVEILYDGNRLFYGPLNVPDAQLFPNLIFSGITGTINKLEVFELLTPEERDTRIKPEINKGYRQGMTRLHAAALHGTKEDLDALVKLGAKLDVKDDDGLTPLQRALVDFGNWQALTKLGATADLHSACAMPDKKLAPGLIKAAPPPPKDEPFTPLHFAATTHNTDIAKLLLDKGYDVNARSKTIYKDSTALHWAVRHDCIDMVHFLLSRNADPGIVDSFGRSPADLAHLFNKEKIAKLIEDWQAGKKPPFTSTAAPEPPKPGKPTSPASPPKAPEPPLEESL